MAAQCGVIACTLGFLFVGAHCQTCANDECENAPVEVTEQGKAHALLQKKTRTETLAAQHPFPTQFQCFSYAMGGQCSVKMPDGTIKEGSCGVSADGMTGLCRLDPSWGAVCPELLGSPSPEPPACTWAGFPGVCTQDPYLGAACNVWVQTKPTDPPASTCPAQCKSPTCKQGNSWNGGFPLQPNGVCSHTCSKAYGGVRYCGKGSSYTFGDSIDCSGCKDTCPQTCYEPTCVGGNPTNGGLELSSYKCLGVCSLPYDGIRYCGTGKDYLKGDSVDCTACDTTEKPGGSGKPPGGSGKPEEATCSAKCESPKCVEGGAHNGGVALANGKCNQHCSKEFAGIRYCGWGDAYKSGDSVDCRPCTEDKYLPAPDYSTACPSGYTPVNDIDECMHATPIAGTDYKWSGVVGCDSAMWPRAGCFTWTTTKYFSTCEETRPLSQHSHYGVCKKTTR